MPSYETLDTIADAYTPLLAFAALTLIIRALIESQWRTAGTRLLMLSVLLAIAYGFMFIDALFNIWSLFGLDYSTHTAVSLVLIFFLITNTPRLTSLWVVSLIAYVLLMLYQGYHTVTDIIITAIAVSVPVWLLLARCGQYWPFTRADKSPTRSC